MIFSFYLFAACIWCISSVHVILKSFDDFKTTKNHLILTADLERKSLSCWQACSDTKNLKESIQFVKENYKKLKKDELEQFEIEAKNYLKEKEDYYCSLEEKENGFFYSKKQISQNQKFRAYPNWIPVLLKGSL